MQARLLDGTGRPNEKITMKTNQNFRDTAKQIGTSYLWIDRTGKLIQILGYEENAKIVADALHGDTK